MSFVGKAIGSVLGGVTGELTKKSDAALERALANNRPVSVFSPGFDANFSNGGVRLDRNPAVQSALDRVNQSVAERLTGLRGLRMDVQPGFGRLTDAQRQAFELARERIGDAKRASVSTLRDNLARRGVLGSSFAQDSINRTGMEFDRQIAELGASEGEALSRSFLQELELTKNFLDEEFTTAVSGVTTALNQLNLEGQMAINIANRTQSALAANAQLTAEIASANAKGAGQIVGSLLSIGKSAAS